MNTEQTPETDASSGELWEVLKRYKWLVISLPTAAVVASLVIASSIAAQWEATAVVRVGQVGQIAPRSDVLIEPPLVAAERVGQRSFQDAVLVQLGQPASREDPRAVLYRSSLKATPVPNADFMRIRIRAFSSEEAIATARATCQHLRIIHDARVAETVDGLRKRAAAVNEQLSAIREQRERLIQVAAQKQTDTAQGVRATEQLILSDLLNRLDTENRRLEELRFASQEALTSARTYSTAIVEDVSVSDEPVWPRTGSLAAFSGVAALVLAVLCAFLLNAIRPKEKPRQHEGSVRSDSPKGPKEGPFL